MGTISTAFSITSGALQADQAALSIVANNVANANTAGYTREIANFQENDPITIGGVSVGQGVTETGATSVRDRVLSQRLDQQQQLAASSSSRLTALNTVQALFIPDSGTTSSTAGDIGNDLTSFFSSLSTLEGNATSNSDRQGVLTAATTLAGDISSAAASLNSQSASLDQDATGVVSQINALTASIAGLNQQIESTSPNGDAGVLEDQRQNDISQLSNLVGINQITTEKNGVSITTTGGTELVDGTTAFAMTSGMSGGVTHFFVGAQDVTTSLAGGGGELGGYLTVRDQDIPSVMNSLDLIAHDVTTSVNALNESGTDYNGATSVSSTITDQLTGKPLVLDNSHDIFAEPSQAPDLQGQPYPATWNVALNGPVPTGTTYNAAASQPASGYNWAANPNGYSYYPISTPYPVAGAALAMSVVMTDPNKIAAAANGAAAGDNSNAMAMANLGTQGIVSSETPNNFYSNFVSSLGASITEVKTDNTAQTASVTQLTTQSNALSAVSLDDEASSMTNFERSYQSASQVFSMLNQVLTSALNLGDPTAVS